MSARYELPPELNIYSALSAREALLAWVGEQGESAKVLEISAREVAEVDGAGLQLLAALSNMGRAWQLVESSDAFALACRTVGLSQWLQLGVVHNAQGGAA
ncbi:MAG: hypothetical protein NTU86_04595 [Burkholderiales bacterium]|nr:hypothetical protein [Burkholderiales bacterium]